MIVGLPKQFWKQQVMQWISNGNMKYGMQRKIISTVKFYLVPPLTLFIKKYGTMDLSLERWKCQLVPPLSDTNMKKYGTISLQKEENVRDDTSSVRGTMLLVWVVSAKQNKTDKRLLSSSFQQLWETLNLPVELF